MSRSPNCDARPPGVVVDMLVVHYTGMESAEAAVDRLCDAAAKVSAHYVVGEDGKVTALVDEGKRAWHAGEAYWRGATDINARSIGIELVNPGHEFGYRPFPESQMMSLEILCNGILGRHPVAPGNIVGHSDVAPRRKLDPGELFDWRRLADAGIGLWPSPASPGGDAPTMLAAIGYEAVDAEASIRAFQRRFRPTAIDGIADDETCALIAGLLALTGPAD